MAPGKAELESPARWYLIARHGDLRLRLEHETRLGEDDGGELLFDPPDSAGMVALLVEPDGVLLICLRAGATLMGAAGDSSRSVALTAGERLTLELPNNTVSVGAGGRQGTAGTPRKLYYQASGAHSEPGSLPRKAPRRSRRREIAAAVLSSARQEKPAGVAPPTFTRADAADLEIPTLVEPVERTGRHASAIPTLVERAGGSSGHAPKPMAPIVVQEVLAREVLTGSPVASRGSTVPLIVLALLLLGLPIRDAATPTAGRPVSAPIVQPSLTLLGSSAALLNGGDQGANPRVVAELTIIAAEPPTADGQSAVAEQPAASSPPATRTLDPRLRQLNARLLEEADRLYRAGAIIEPLDRNAVKLLERVLRNQPTNEQALATIHRCAESLVEQARVLLEAGDEYQARNLVEEVLAFHPTHPGATELWQRLTGETRRPRNEPPAGDGLPAAVDAPHAVTSPAGSPPPRR